MAVDPLYRLLAWLSPAYPIGAFSYSHGIETAVEEGFIKDRASLVAWLETVLTGGTGRVEAPYSRRPGARPRCGTGRPLTPSPSAPPPGAALPRWR